MLSEIYYNEVSGKSVRVDLTLGTNFISDSNSRIARLGAGEKLGFH